MDHLAFLHTYSYVSVSNYDERVIVSITLYKISPLHFGGD